MKRSRFTEKQIIAILREQEAGVPVTELCHKRQRRRSPAKSPNQSIGGACRALTWEVG